MSTMFQLGPGLGNREWDAGGGQAHHQRAPSADLMRGQMPTVPSLRAALDEAGQRSAQNQQILLEAGERGQRLLEEKLMLADRLEVCSHEMRESIAWQQNFDRSCHRACVDHNNDPGCHDSSNLQKQLSAQRVEIQLLKQQNLMLAEELEERESALASEIQSIGDAAHSKAALQREEARCQTRMIAAEVKEAAAHATRSKEMYAAERAAMEREVEEARHRTANVLSTLGQRLTDVRIRNADLWDKLATERELCRVQTLPLQEEVEGLRAELKQEQGSERARELLGIHLESTAAALHHWTTQTCLNYDCNSAGRHLSNKLAHVPMNVLRSSDPSRDENSSNIDAESETWDGLSDFTTSSRESQVKQREQRQRVRSRNSFVPVEQFVNIAEERQVDTVDETQGAPQPESSWATLFELVGDTLLKIDEMVQHDNTE